MNRDSDETNIYGCKKYSFNRLWFLGWAKLTGEL